MSEHIQIGAVAPRVQHVADGVTTKFAYPYPIFGVADLAVYLDDAKQTTGFTVNGAGASAGGDVTFDTAPSNGVTVTLAREIAIARTSDFQEGGEFRASVLNDELDYLTAALQQVADDVDRTIALSTTDPTTGLVLPDPAVRAGRYLGFDGTGQLIAATGSEDGKLVSTYMATVLDDTDAAAARATLGARAHGDPAPRNRIINGVAPFVDQRGQQSPAASFAYFVDRFMWHYNGSGEVSALMTSFLGHDWITISVVTADATIASGDVYDVEHRIEGNNIVDFRLGASGAATVTLSFKHAHTKPGVYCVAFGDAGGNRSYTAEYTQDVGDAEEMASVTLTLDTGGPWLSGANLGLKVIWTLAAGTDYHREPDVWGGGFKIATANQVNAMDAVPNKFRIRDVQLELGSVATAPEQIDYATKLAQCKRYNQKGAYGVQGNAPTASTFALAATLPVEMRAAPTLALLDTSVQTRVNGSSTVTSSGSTLADSGSYTTGYFARLTGYSSLTVGDQLVVIQDDWLSLKAEL